MLHVVAQEPKRKSVCFKIVQMKKTEKYMYLTLKGTDLEQTVVLAAIEVSSTLNPVVPAPVPANTRVEPQNLLVLVPATPALSSGCGMMM